MWDPLSKGPQAVDFAAHLLSSTPSDKTKDAKTVTASSEVSARAVIGSNGKSLRASWLGLEPSSGFTPSLWLSQGQSYVLASIAGLPGQDSDSQIP